MIEKPEKKIIEHANGGKGHLILEPIAGPDILKDKCRLYVKATLEKGCSMGIHQHKGDGEIYYILSGKGLYTDNDTTYEMKPGDAAFCKTATATASRTSVTKTSSSWDLSFTISDVSN